MPAKREAKKRNPETPLAADFPTQADLDWAAEYFRGVNHAADLKFLRAEFRDHHLMKDNRWRDWEAAWRNWCRRSFQYATAKTSGSSVVSKSSALDLSSYKRAAADTARRQEEDRHRAEVTGR